MPLKDYPPNFQEGQRLLVNKVGYFFGAPSRGDVIIFKFPNDPKKFFIKRIIGLPGDTIQINSGVITILNDEQPSGFTIEEPYVESFFHDTITTVLGEGEYYVLGDNRNSSKDSRSFGPVNKVYITGKVLFRGWPFDRVTLFDTPVYEN